MRVADLLIDRLNKVHGVEYVSLLTGNGALVINDAIALNKNIKPICVFHEQDAGYIALGYSKYTNKLSVVNPTTGCAGTNCITPLLAAYQDHVPVLFLSGNVALEQTTRYHRFRGNNLKKLGVQELDIIEVVKPLTKYATFIDKPEKALFELDKAVEIALTPPFGPVWVDLPADVGSSNAEDTAFLTYHSAKKFASVVTEGEKRFKVSKTINHIEEKLKTSEQPLILLGNGVRLSSTQDQAIAFAEKHNIPIATTYGGIDLINYRHPLYTGGPIGVKGCKASNLAIQHADLLLIFGCCMNIPQVGYMHEKFSPNSYKIMVDCSINAMSKPIIKIDYLLNCDLEYFFYVIEQLG